jgi:tRNA/tmRNA/rRNA uracil-C5-methylase (TrmA/RlmC/RlmD family)
MKETTWHPIVASPEIYGYRNKLEFSFGKYISKKEEIHDEFRFGFHKQGEFDRIVDCDFCVLASDQVNAIFREVDKLSRASGMTTYDPKTFRGVWRHLVVRESRATGECMVVFSVNTSDELFDRTVFDAVWKQLQGFPGVATLVLLHNPGRADIVTGEVELLKGSGFIEEKILGKSFEIAPKSFFQTNSPGAEVLYSTAF